MSVLPLIDALILGGWSSLMAGFLLKAIYLTTAYRPTIFGLRPIDCLWVAICSLLFALALAARTWVKAYEPELMAWRRRARLAESGYGEEEPPTPRAAGPGPGHAHAEEPRRSAAGH